MLRNPREISHTGGANDEISGGGLPGLIRGDHLEAEGSLAGHRIT